MPQPDVLPFATVYPDIMAEQHERDMRNYTEALCLAYDEIFELDRKESTGRVVYSTHVSKLQQGMRPAEALLSCWLERMPDPAERRQLSDAVSAGLDGLLREPRAVMYRLVVDGRSHWCCTTLVSVGGRYILCCNKDMGDVVFDEDRRTFSSVSDIIGMLPVGICVYRHTAGRVLLLYANDPLCEIMGISRAEYDALLAEHGALFTADEIEGVLGIALPEASADGSVECEAVLRRRDGASVDVRLRGSSRRCDDGDTAVYLVVADITDEVRERRARSWQNERYRLLSEMTHAISFDYDSLTDTVLLYLDRTGHGMEAQVIPDYLKTLLASRSGVVHGSSMADVRAMFERVRQGAQGETIEYRADYYGTGYEWYRTNLSVVHDEGGAWHLVGLIENVQTEYDLREQAERDAVTGLANHATARLRIDEALADERVRPRCVCAVMDIDDFKRVNDELGHIEGDALLQGIGRHLGSSFRESDVVGRMGGDEFVLLLKDVDLDAALAKLSDVLAKLPASLAGAVRRVPSMSVGVCQVDFGDRAYRDVVAKADEALYRAKRSGRNRMGVYGREALTVLS